MKVLTATVIMIVLSLSLAQAETLTGRILHTYVHSNGNTCFMPTNNSVYEPAGDRCLNNYICIDPNTTAIKQNQIFTSMTTALHANAPIRVEFDRELPVRQCRIQTFSVIPAP